MTARPLLEVEGLSAGYGGREVLHGVSLSLKPADVVVVVGPNGHGKTTLLRAMSGLVRPSSGSLRFDGADLTRLSPDRIAGLGVRHIPQGDLLFTDMTVRENLQLGGYSESGKAEARRLFDAALALFPRLAERLDQRAGSLSGGERRMLSIGRGLCGSSRLLLVDEPSLGLAPLVIDQIYAAIGQIHALGKAILLVEENPSRGAQLGGTLHVLSGGRIAWSGAAAEAETNRFLQEAYLGA